MTEVYTCKTNEKSYELELDEKTVSNYKIELGNICLWLKNHEDEIPREDIEASEKYMLLLKIAFLSFEVHKHECGIDRYTEGIRLIRKVMKECEEKELKDFLLNPKTQQNLFYDWYRLEIACFDRIKGFRSYFKKEIIFEKSSKSN
jgi:hypothetical protein